MQWQKIVTLTFLAQSTSNCDYTNSGQPLESRLFTSV